MVSMPRAVCGSTEVAVAVPGVVGVKRYQTVPCEPHPQGSGSPDSTVARFMSKVAAKGDARTTVAQAKTSLAMAAWGASIQLETAHGTWSGRAGHVAASSTQLTGGHEEASETQGAEATGAGHA